VLIIAVYFGLYLFELCDALLYGRVCREELKHGTPRRRDTQRLGRFKAHSVARLIVLIRYLRQSTYQVIRMAGGKRRTSVRAVLPVPGDSVYDYQADGVREEHGYHPGRHGRSQAIVAVVAADYHRNSEEYDVAQNGNDEAREGNNEHIPVLYMGELVA